MVKQGMLIKNDIPGGKMTNSFIHTTIHLREICMPTMNQAQL